MHPRRTASPYILSGIAKCGHCRRALVGQDAKSGHFSYYVCGTRMKRGAEACQAKRLGKERFEQAMVEELKNRVLTPDSFQELVRLVNDDLGSQANDAQSQLEVISNDLTGVRRRFDKLYDAVETGKITLDDLSPRIKSCGFFKPSLS